MVFLSDLQVTAYWVTNLSLNAFSFLLRTPPLLLFSFQLWNFRILGQENIHSLKHNYFELNWNRIWTTVGTLTFSYSAPSTE